MIGSVLYEIFRLDQERALAIASKELALRAMLKHLVYKIGHVKDRSTQLQDAGVLLLA
jgi:hypothetical protein